MRLPKPQKQTPLIAADPAASLLLLLTTANKYPFRAINLHSQTHPFLVVLLLPWCCRWRRGCGGHGGVLVSVAGVADEAAAWIVVAVGGCGAVWRGDSG
nr:hypothetical protein [Tanacetum cinerariifolium]